MSVSLRHVKEFITFAAKQLKLGSIPHIRFVGASENAKQAFGHFIGDRKPNGTITVRITDRHPIDVMRTIAHELIHHRQRVSGVPRSEQMKEDEANALAGRIMREYDTRYPGTFKDRPITSIREEGEVAANAVGSEGMGSSSKGPIQGYDPLLFNKMIKRKSPKGLRQIVKK